MISLLGLLGGIGASHALDPEASRQEPDETVCRTDLLETRAIMVKGERDQVGWLASTPDGMFLHLGGDTARQALLVLTREDDAGLQLGKPDGLVKLRQPKRGEAQLALAARKGDAAIVAGGAGPIGAVHIRDSAGESRVWMGTKERDGSAHERCGLIVFGQGSNAILTAHDGGRVVAAVKRDEDPRGTGLFLEPPLSRLLLTNAIGRDRLVFGVGESGSAWAQLRDPEGEQAWAAGATPQKGK